MKKALKRLKNLAMVVKREKARVGQTPAHVVHAENKWRLLRYVAREQGLAHDTPILLIPSLINRHYVLDLMPGKSFAEYLVAQGHDVFIIDWGTPGDEDRYLTFDTITDDYIGRAVRKAAKFSPDEKVHVLGYCLGGTLATIHAAHRPEHIASLLPLAAPISFADRRGLLGAWTNTKNFDLDVLVEATGNVPWQLLQSSFHLLRPTMNLSKATHFVDQAWDDQFLDGFFAIETWSNDNVSFPGACYKRYIQELYRDDLLMKGEFTLHGKRVDLSRITCPVLAITFIHDHIVPLSNAAPLMDVIASKDSTLVKMSGGHVGAVVSRKASTKLWPQISEWFAERTAATRAGKAPVEEQDDSRAAAG